MSRLVDKVSVNGRHVNRQDKCVKDPNNDTGAVTTKFEARVVSLISLGHF